MTYTPANCFEGYVLSVWHALSTGRNTKAKAEARESFYGMLLTMRGVQPQVSDALVDHVQTQYVNLR